MTGITAGMLLEPCSATAVGRSGAYLGDKRQPAPEIVQRHRSQVTAVYQDAATAGGHNAEQCAHQGGLARPCTVKRVLLLLMISSLCRWT